MDKANYNDVYIPQDSVGVGHLAIAGKNTLLKLLNMSPAVRSNEEILDHYGTLRDGSKASLLGCITKGLTDYGWGGERAQYETCLSPCYVLIGNSFINSDEAKIQAIHYYFENVGLLVHIPGTFGTINLGREEFRNILEADYRRREKIAQKYNQGPVKFKPEIGDNPILQYFSGRLEIMRCCAHIGSVAMANRVSHSIGFSNEVRINNKITVSLEFAAPTTVNKAFESLKTLHSFFELCLGERQRYLRIEVQLAKGGEEADNPMAEYLQVYWSHCNARISGETSPTSCGGVLLNAGTQQAEFEKVLSNWLNTEGSVGEARGRFTNAIYPGSYSVEDRIICLANVFDLLPSTHLPSKKKLDKSIEDEVKESQRRFNKRSRRRIWKASLCDKIYHRADILIRADSNRFTELHLPCKQAVLCRNHFVHGSNGAFDYRKESDAFFFLINTLGFVFAASDLIELGWNYNAWVSKGFGLSHNFGLYVDDYEVNLRKLKELINRSNISRQQSKSTHRTHRKK